MSDWYKKSYRRNLVDMHIEDWDERFLSKLDPKAYVENLKKAQVQSAMVYANSHVGYCYWPTKQGHMHKGLNGRDFFGEVTKEIHNAGMDAIAYYTLTFVNDEYHNHPEWQMRTADGLGARDLRYGWVVSGRYGLCCLNNPEYRAYVAREVEDLIDSYPLEGLFYDMNFWPIVCYCDCCRERYRKETGREIPTVVDWNNPEWLKYAQHRQMWLVDSAQYFSDVVKQKNPEMTVEHNFVAFLRPWIGGCTDAISETVDFNSGDSYGNVAGQNFVCKMHNTMSKNLPYEFMVSRCYPGLANHTSIKPTQYLQLENAMALANGGAFFFIDAIDPEGTMCGEVYETMGDIFEKTKKYEPFFGPYRMEADVAVYYSSHSKCTMQENGRPVDDIAIETTQKIVHIQHNEAAITATRILQENHIPHTVLTKKNLKNLKQYSVLVLPSIFVMDAEEEQEITQWLQDGGKLYLSSTAQLPFAKKLFGLDFQGETEEEVTYLYPTNAAKQMMEGTKNQTAPITVLQSQQKILPAKDAIILAQIGLPYTDPADRTVFASIHSNPPAGSSEIAGVIMQNIGKGTAIWTSVPFELAAPAYETHRKIFANLVRQLADRPFAFSSSAQPCVDFTLYDQCDKNRFLVHCVNCQEHLPIIPLNHVELSVHTHGRAISRVLLLPEQKQLPFHVVGDYVTVALEQLEIYEAFLIEYDADIKGSN